MSKLTLSEREAFRRYLEGSSATDSHSAAAVNTRMSKIDAIESLGIDLNDSVISDSKMYDTLCKIKPNDTANQSLQNVARHYYHYKNGKQFPRITSYQVVNAAFIQKILRKLSSGAYPCFTSEAQLRDAFSVELAKSNSDYTILPEFKKKVPAGWPLTGKIIHSDLIAINNATKEKVVFEFKYKTLKGTFNTPAMDIFLNDQSDTTNGRYDLWEDIFRLESYVKSHTLGITKGFSIFITNNKSYYSVPTKSSLSADFSIAPGQHKHGTKTWNFTKQSKNSVQKSNVSPLTIANDYSFDYSTYSKMVDTDGKTHEFKQLVVEIS